MLSPSIAQSECAPASTTRMPSAAEDRRCGPTSPGAPGANSASGSSSASASVFSTESRSMGWVPRSTSDTQATGRPTLAASSGWDRPCLRRSWATLRPSTCWYSLAFTCAVPPVAGQCRTCPPSSRTIIGRDENCISRIARKPAARKCVRCDCVPATTLAGPGPAAVPPQPSGPGVGPVRQPTDGALVCRRAAQLIVTRRNMVVPQAVRANRGRRGDAACRHLGQQRHRHADRAAVGRQLADQEGRPAS